MCVAEVKWDAFKERHRSILEQLGCMDEVRIDLGLEGLKYAEREAGLGGGVSMTLLCKGNNKEASREEMLHGGDSGIRLWSGF